MQKTVNFLLLMPKKIGIILIRIYQLILRPLFPSSCRFYPTCSVYTVQSIEKYGLFKGVFFGIKRISKCHGGNPGGVDEVL
jgi:putative membrane protein insertion efficiency factor